MIVLRESIDEIVAYLEVLFGIKFRRIVKANPGGIIAQGYVNGKVIVIREHEGCANDCTSLTVELFCSDGEMMDSIKENLSEYSKDAKSSDSGEVRE